MNNKVACKIEEISGYGYTRMFSRIPIAGESISLKNENTEIYYTFLIEKVLHTPDDIGDVDAILYVKEQRLICKT